MRYAAGSATGLRLRDKSGVVKRALVNSLEYPDHIPEYDQAYRVFLDVYQDNLCERGRIYDDITKGLDNLLRN